MPKYTDFSVFTLQGLLGTFESFLYCKILMIACKNTGFFVNSHRESKISNNINEAMLGKDTIEESFKIGKCCAFIASICGFPLHISVEWCSNRTHPSICHITYHEHLTSSKELRNNAHIVLQLLVGFLRISNFTRRRLQFNDGDRQTVDEYHDVSTFGRFAIYYSPLISYNKRVIVYMVRVRFDYLDMVAT